MSRKTMKGGATRYDDAEYFGDNDPLKPSSPFRLDRRRSWMAEVRQVQQETSLPWRDAMKEASVRRNERQRALSGEDLVARREDVYSKYNRFYRT